MLNRGLVALAFLLLYAGAACAAGCDAPSPTIHPVAAPSLPKSAAAFAGSWQGQWPVVVRDQILPLCARLYVAVTASRAATIEQCTGSNQEARLRPECRVFAAQIDGNEMTFTYLEGTVFTFTLADVGGMLGKAVSADHRSATRFTPIE
jgi:hypothetical protein